MPESNDETAIKPTGEILCAIGPAKCRSTNIMPEVYTRIMVPDTLAVPSMTEFCHFCGPSSVAAVISMQTAHSRNMGRKHSLNMSPVDTPEATRSVLGNRAGMSIKP